MVLGHFAEIRVELFNLLAMRLGDVLFNQRGFLYISTENQKIKN